MAELTIESVVTDESLTVTYCFTNRLLHPVFLQHRTEGFVHISEANAAVLFLGTAKPPPGVSVYWVGTPPADRVLPGAALRGSVRQPLPLVEHTLGVEPESEVTLYDQTRDPVHVEWVALVIDFLPEVRPVKGHQYPDGSWHASGATPTRAEAWIDRRSSPLSAVRRRIPFWRAAPQTPRPA